jgi:hypothetical protein
MHLATHTACLATHTTCIATHTTCLATHTACLAAHTACLAAYTMHLAAHTHVPWYVPDMQVVLLSAQVFSESCALLKFLLTSFLKKCSSQ